MSGRTLDRTRRGTFAAALLALTITSGCERRRPPAPEPIGSGVPFPEITTIDWNSLSYDLGSLGTVVATGGRAAFQLVEDELGVLRATQLAGVTSEFSGVLELGVPRYVDLDGDDHDEAVIPFQLDSTGGETPRVTGGFVYTLRNGVVLKLATIPTTVPGLEIDGATITGADGKRWGWDDERRAVVER